MPPSMTVDIALFAYLSDYQPDGQGGRGTRSFELEPTATVTEVIEMLGLPDEPRIVFINGVHAAENAVLNEGDRLAIFPPVAGG
jgi:molybdopterin synthase sulfur carrier subunit